MTEIEHFTSPSSTDPAQLAAELDTAGLRTRLEVTRGELATTNERIDETQQLLNSLRDDHTRLLADVAAILDALRLASDRGLE